MSKVRPPYPAEFRQQMVELVRAVRSPAQLSREFGVTAQSITNWVGQAAIDESKPLPGKEGLTTAEREELCACAGSCARSRWSATSWQRLRPGLPAAAMRLQRSLRTRDGESGRPSCAHHVPRRRCFRQRGSMPGATVPRPSAASPTR